MTRGGLATLRTAFGSVFRTRDSGPIALRTGVRGLLRRLPDPTRAAVQQRVLDETGVNLERLTTDRLGKLVRTDPQAVVTMLRLIEREAGVSAEPLVRTVRQTMVSRAVSKSLRPPPKGVAFPEAFRGGVLDPDTLLTELAAVRKSLGDDGTRAVFGTEGVKALNELSRTLGGAHRAVEFARAGLPQRVVPPATVPVRLLPLAAAMMVGLGLGGRTGEVLEVAAGVRGLAELQHLLPALLSTGPGMRLVGAWIDMSRRGVADRVLIPTIARALPGVLASLQEAGSGGLPPLAPGVAGAFLAPQSAGGTP